MLEDRDRLGWLSAQEDAKLRTVIREHWPAHDPEFDVAINTGMRASGPYRLTWDQFSRSDAIGRTSAPRAVGSAAATAAAKKTAEPASKNEAGSRAAT